MPDDLTNKNAMCKPLDRLERVCGVGVPPEKIKSRLEALSSRLAQESTDDECQACNGTTQITRDPGNGLLFSKNCDRCEAGRSLTIRQQQYDPTAADKAKKARKEYERAEDLPI